MNINKYDYFYIKKAFKENGVPLKNDFKILARKGYGAKVFIINYGLNKEIVLKKYKSFRPCKVIPFYHRGRVELEVDIYNKLKKIDNTLVPKIYAWNKESGELFIEKVSNDFKLLTDYLTKRKNVPPTFMDRFAVFLFKKYKLIKRSHLCFYNYK